MQNLQSLMETLSGWVWGPYMLVLIVGTGIFLTFRLLFWQFRMLPLAFKQVFGKHPEHSGDISQFASLMTGIIITAFSALVILGGIKSISKASSVIVPIMAVGYVAGGLIIILNNLELVAPALKMIFTYAFTGEAAVGGAIGAAIRYGVARGVFSNEAGMGSAPIAAAAAKTDHPARQGLVSMTGTFIDTIIVCSITGIVLVMGYIMAGNSFGDQTGAVLTIGVFDKLLPGVGGWVVTFGIIFFAYSTILGWSYYGEKCATYLLGEKFVLPYRIIYIASVFVGCIATLDLVWLFADTFNGLMAVPNLIALLLLSGVIAKESKDFIARRKSGELY